ncbi:glycosyltransferase family 2 protein [Candidatus Saccharibacteria bacterium]|nr:MAG: glycosyltransferase family 2 protein [Candidatus Saccharibacteria bacterium]
MSKKISIVTPAYNEDAGIAHYYERLKAALPARYSYEILFVDDGSTDDTLKVLKSIMNKDKSVRIISFSRNFGKEAATTAGIVSSTGEAILVVDADGQHPVDRIDDFLKEWERGSKVVIGVRTANQKEGIIKRYGSKLFYALFNAMANENLVPGSTDFRLIDASVKIEFAKLKEKNRITRALIDWLGYKKTYITFTANAREFGEATYTNSKLVKLAFNSFVSLTTFPLYASGYLGLIIIPLSVLLGLFIIVEQFMLGDPLQLNVTGSGILGTFIVFLVGIILACQGLIAMYISRIYEEAKDRPLYIIEHDSSSNEK